MNKILNELTRRGMISNLSDEKKFDECIEQKKAVYVGFDPSFISLHLGNFVMLRTLQIFKKYGIEVIPVIGGATGQIGDPSGKSAERNLLDESTINKNIETISEQLKHLTQCKTIVNNKDFYVSMTIFDFFKNIGKDFNVNYLIAKETIKNRLETGISYTEFSYTLIQAYDWFVLNQKYNVGIQCGGSDQWGNITSGLELIRKRNGVDAIVAGLTISLLTKSDGTKFGKSEKGAIFLDKNLTSVFDMYQFLFNQNDNDIEKLLLFLASYEIEDIEKIMIDHKTNPSMRIAQKKLCENVIEQIHGIDEYNKVVQLAELLFKEQYDQISQNDFKSFFEKMPWFKIDSLPKKLIDVLVETKIVNSKRIARELFASNSILVNGRLANEDLDLDSSFLLHNKYIIIKKGKKNFFVITL